MDSAIVTFLTFVFWALIAADAVVLAMLAVRIAKEMMDDE